MLSEKTDSAAVRHAIRTRTFRGSIRFQFRLLFYRRRRPLWNVGTPGNGATSVVHLALRAVEPRELPLAFDANAWGMLVDLIAPATPVAGGLAPEAIGHRCC